MRDKARMIRQSHRQLTLSLSSSMPGFEPAAQSVSHIHLGVNQNAPSSLDQSPLAVEFQGLPTWGTPYLGLSGDRYCFAGLYVLLIQDPEKGAHDLLVPLRSRAVP